MAKKKKKRAPQRAAKPSPKKRAATRKIAAKKQTPKKKPSGAELARTRKAKQLARARHERAQRGAETRKRGGKRITSRTKRYRATNVQYNEIGFEFADILSGRNPSNPERRDQFDLVSRPYIGRDVQITYYVTVYGDGERVGKQRVRRIARNFQGTADIARYASSAVREAMRTLGSSGEVYIQSVSLALVGDGE
jgi:hypothetical protein